MKKIKFVPFVLSIITLFACATNNSLSGVNSSLKDNTSENDFKNIKIDENLERYGDVLSKKSLNALSYQVTTSMLSFNNSNNKTLKMKKGISSEAKQDIERLLPTIDVLLNNASFETVLGVSGTDMYLYKQTISFTNFSNETQTIELHYNVSKLNQKTETKSVKKEYGLSEEILTSEEFRGDDSQTSSQSKETSSQNETADYVSSEIITSELVTSLDYMETTSLDYAEVTSESINEEYEEETEIRGIACFEDYYYPFIGKNEIEVESDEKETSLELKIFTSDDQSSYIKVKQEVEIEDEEIEEEYKYEIIENNEKVYSFAFEKEKEAEKEESKIKLFIDNTKYSFKIYTLNEETFIRVKVENSNDEKESIIYKKVITRDDEENQSVSFLEVTE